MPQNLCPLLNCRDYKSNRKSLIFSLPKQNPSLNFSGTYSFQNFFIPLRTNLFAEREFSRDVIDNIRFDAKKDVIAGCVYLRLDRSIFLVIQIAVMVAVKNEKLSSRFKNSQPFFISRFRIFKIPYKVSADHCIKRSIRKREMLCVSSAEFDIVIAVSIKQIFCFFQHSFRIISGGHIQAERGQKERKESRAAPDIQHF